MRVVLVPRRGCAWAWACTVLAGEAAEGPGCLGVGGVGSTEAGEEASAGRCKDRVGGLGAGSKRGGCKRTTAVARRDAGGAGEVHCSS